jgi:hypothetical protein
MLEGLDLADGLGELSSHRRGEYFHGLDHTIGVDDEPTSPGTG